MCFTVEVADKRIGYIHSSSTAGKVTTNVSVIGVAQCIMDDSTA